MRLVRSFFILTILVWGVFFALLNTDVVTLHLLFAAWQLPLSLALALAFVLGACLVAATSAWSYWRLQRRYRALQQANSSST